MVRKRFVQLPYHAGAYIQSGGAQRGGGFFSALADNAKRFFFPWLTIAGKHAKKAIGNVAKSKVVQEISDHAKQAAKHGIHEVAGQILQGENVGQAIKNVGRATKDSIAKKIKDEAYKAGTNLRNQNKKPDLKVKNTRKRKKKSYPYTVPPKKSAKSIL